MNSDCEVGERRREVRSMVFIIDAGKTTCLQLAEESWFVHDAERT